MKTLGASFTCPRCALTSHNPEDAGQGYCGACHFWTGSEPELWRALHDFFDLLVLLPAGPLREKVSSTSWTCAQRLLDLDPDVASPEAEGTN